MDRWRSFFSKAGEDVWTIIEQAILLAAHDHPREFRAKRCDIAEILFAARPRPEDADAARLSMSVITNCTYQTDVGEARDDEHASAVHTKEQTGRDTYKEGVDAHACMSTLVYNIKEALADSMQSDGAVLCTLRKLECLHISVEVLKETEIGKQVNNLRKHSCKEIRLLAKSLVRHWKELVDDWVKRAGTSGHTTSERANVEEQRVLTLLDKDAHFVTDLPGESEQRFYSDVKGIESYLETPEERGSSSRAELAGLDVVGRSEKSRSIASSIANRELLEDESNISVDKLTGRDISMGKATVLSRSYGGKLSSEDLHASKLQGGYCSQRQKQSRLTTDQKASFYEGVLSEVNLDAASKRKPQDGLIHIENAKRQQVAHPTNLKDCSRAGLLQSKIPAQNNHWNQASK